MNEYINDCKYKFLKSKSKRVNFAWFITLKNKKLCYSRQGKPLILNMNCLQVSPPYVPPPQPPQFTNPASSSMHAVTATTASSTTTSLERRPSESSTDSLSQDPARTAKDKRSSVLSGFFRKKRATHL